MDPLICASNDTPGDGEIETILIYGVVGIHVTGGAPINGRNGWVGCIRGIVRLVVVHHLGVMICGNGQGVGGHS